MSDNRIKAQLIQTAIVWGVSFFMVATLVACAGSFAAEALEAFEQLKGGLNAKH